MEKGDKEEKRDLDPDEEAEMRFSSANFTCAETWTIYRWTKFRLRMRLVENKKGQDKKKINADVEKFLSMDKFYQMSSFVKLLRYICEICVLFLLYPHLYVFFKYYD